MDYSIPFGGKPGPTTRIAVGDSVDNLADEFSSDNNSPAIGMLVTCETNDVRFTMGGDISTPTYPPTQGASGLGHVLKADGSLMLFAGQIRTFQFIAKTNGSAAVLQVTPFFRPGG